MAYSPGEESAGHSTAMQRWLTHTVVSGSWGHSKKADLELRGRGHLIWALGSASGQGKGTEAATHIEALGINEAGWSGGYTGGL